MKNKSLEKVIEIAKIKSEGAAEPLDLCWLHDTKSGEDSYENYCYECAKKLANKKTLICGGNGSFEDDIPRYCEDCEALLNVYVLDVDEAIGRLPDEINGVDDWREVLMILESVTEIKRGSNTEEFLSKILRENKKAVTQ